MKFLFLCLLLSFFCIENWAQITNKSKQPFGYYIDYNKIPLDNYCDFDYIPQKGFNIAVSIKGNFIPGYFYNAVDNKKFPCEIKISEFYSEFQYRFGDSTDTSPLKPVNCNGFVVGVDSFTVIKGFTVERILGKRTISEPTFVDVVSKTPHFTLYKHLSSETYIIKPDTSSHYYSFPDRSNIKFNEMALSYFGDCPTIRRKISLKQYNNSLFKPSLRSSSNEIYSNTDYLNSIVKEYEYYLKFKKQEKIFLSDSWNDISDSLKAKYYGVITEVNDSIWTIKYYLKSDQQLLCMGHYSGFAPNVNDGDFIYFYPNGNPRKSIKYVNGNIDGTVIEFNIKGEPVYKYKYKREERLYDFVAGEDGQNKLDKNGNGGETIIDTINNRNIFRRFRENQIVVSVFSQNGKVIYQKCDQNTGIKNSRLIKKLTGNGFSPEIFDRKDKDGKGYPIEMFKKYKQGVVLVKFLVDSAGNTVNFSIIQGLDSICDHKINEFFDVQKSNLKWYSAYENNQSFYQEIVVPFTYKIEVLNKAKASYYNYYHDFYWLHQQQQFIQPGFKLPSTPRVNFR